MHKLLNIKKLIYITYLPVLYLPQTYSSDLLPKEETYLKNQPIQGRVLVVDDCKIALKISGKLFKEQGYEIVTAKNRQEAIETLEKFKDIRCVLTDVNMSKNQNIEDGIELTKDIKFLYKTMPVFVNSSTDYKKNAIDAGAENFFMKNLQKEHVIYILKVVFNSSICNVISSELNTKLCETLSE